jgi:hypothetical protein
MYYAELRANSGAVLFPGGTDHGDFEGLVRGALRDSNAQLHAYAWLPMSAYFLVQVADIPLGRIIQKIAAPHSRSVNRRLGYAGHRFQHPYRATLLQPHVDALDVVKHIHLMALAENDATASLLQPMNSHSAYLGDSTTPWLTMGAVRGLLLGRGLSHRKEYRKLMQENELAFAPARLRNESDSMFRNSNDAAFLHWIRERSLPVRPSLEEIVAVTARRLDINIDELHSISRRRDLTLARATVAWYATNDQIATLSEVARHFNRDPSTLSVGVARHHKERPDLLHFSLADFLGAEASETGERKKIEK